MDSRPWVWLRALIEGLFTRRPLGYFDAPIDREHYRRHPIWPNRVQAHFYGPAWGDKTG